MIVNVSTRARNISIFLLILCCSCINFLSEEDVRVREYGELYFTMTCWWSSQELIAPTIFFCTETVETELISGYISLAVEEDLDGEQFFSICGRNVTLNTGLDLHDILIASMTQYAYNCYATYERNLGNEFDWIWDDSINMLQIIWRPENEKDKILTLFVEDMVESNRVSGSVYYKRGYYN